MNIQRANLAFRIISAVCLTSPWLSASAAFAAEEICSSCGQQVGISGEFGHRKNDASVTIEGAGDNARAFREDVNGKNFTVTISHLPAGKYTISIGEAETQMSAPAERLFDVTSGSVVLATNYDIVASAGGPRKVCYITGTVDHEDDSINGPLTVTFSGRTDNAKFNTFEVKNASGVSLVDFSGSELAEPFTAAAAKVPDIAE